jgi:hypothetical protein
MILSAHAFDRHKLRKNSQKAFSGQDHAKVSRTNIQKRQTRKTGTREIIGKSVSTGCHVRTCEYPSLNVYLISQQNNPDWTNIYENIPIHVVSKMRIVQKLTLIYNGHPSFHIG